MVLNFEQYIKEHFGAITIEYPPNHMSSNNVGPKPLSVASNAIHPSGRIPLHWNNSPFLSGGFSGSGSGRFGADPDEENSEINVDDINSAFDNNLNIHLKISELKKNKDKKSGVYVLLQRALRELDNGQYIRELNDSLEGLPLDIDVDVLQKPTPGTSGSYYDPPEPGDAGEYAITISEDNDILQQLDTNRNIIHVDLEDIISNFVGYVSGLDIANYDKFKDALELSSSLIDAMQNIYDQLDDDYDNDNTSEYSNRDLLEEIADQEEDFYMLKYILSIGYAITKYNKDSGYNKEMRELINSQSGIGVSFFTKQSENLRKIKGKISRELDNFLNIESDIFTINI